MIPAYNEAAVIAQAVREAEESLHGLFQQYEILIVDDGSRDGTAAIVEEVLPIARHTRLIRHAVNRGYGAALRTGFEAARYPLVAFTDADCQFDLTDLAKLADLAKAYTIVVGYRVDRRDTWRRRFFSWGYNQLARTLLGTTVHDVDCALKVFHQQILAGLMPMSKGFFVNTEMMARAHQLGIPVAELPVTHRPRASGASKVSMREIPRTAIRLLQFWWSEVAFRARPAPSKVAVFQARVPRPTGAFEPAAVLPHDLSPARQAARSAPSQEVA